MPMRLEMGDFGEVQSDLLNMAATLATNGQGRVVDEALKKAAEPIRKDMFDQTLIDPKRRSGNLHESITVGKPGTSRGVRRIKTGIFKNKLTTTAPHAHLVEFGHGGPAPAPPHPFIRPAFDRQADNAFRIIREELGKAIDDLKK